MCIFTREIVYKRNIDTKIIALKEQIKDFTNHPFNTHSVHDNNPKLQRLVPQELWMNPLDATAGNIQNSDSVYTYNNRVKFLISAKTTKRVRSGVVACLKCMVYTG